MSEAPPRSGGLTVAKAAQELGYNVMTLYGKIAKNEVVVERIGRNLRIFREDNQQLWSQRRALRASKEEV